MLIIVLEIWGLIVSRELGRGLVFYRESPCSRRSAQFCDEKRKFLVGWKVGELKDTQVCMELFQKKPKEKKEEDVELQLF